jgi:glycosyltransferase involved in cell wall biosynthesis
VTILVAHNYYQHRGGEDAVFEAEAALLAARGHNVVRYTAHNDHVQDVQSFTRGFTGTLAEAFSGTFTGTLISKLALARAAVFNPASYDAVHSLIRQHSPDVLHVHNTLPLLSAAVYAAANDAGVPVVQTLHNYRLLCPNALFFRDGRVCEDCLGKTFALDGILHGCYRGSRSASAVVAGSTAWHTLRGTWARSVTTYIALTEFARQKFIAGGLPAEKIVVKPNFVDEISEGIKTLQTSNDQLHQVPHTALFVGRLSPEKGIVTLLRAWKIFMTEYGAEHGAEHSATAILRIVGDGPLESELRAFIRDHNVPNVELLGRKPLAEVLRQMAHARCLVFPSELYETFGKSMIEAFSCGTPVLCSRLGAMEEVVADGVTGFHFSPADAPHLASTLARLWAMPAPDYAAMRRAARQTYEAHYTADRNGGALEAIYEAAIKAAIRQNRQV